MPGTEKHRSVTVPAPLHEDLGKHHAIGSRGKLLDAAWRHYKACVLQLEATR